MAMTVEATYERGVFKPHAQVDLAEGQTVRLSVVLPENRMAPEEMELLARRVYEGLSEADLAEVEAIALDRSNFMRQPATIEECLSDN